MYHLDLKIQDFVRFYYIFLSAVVRGSFSWGDTFSTYVQLNKSLTNLHRKCRRVSDSLGFGFEIINIAINDAKSAKRMFMCKISHCSELV